MDGISIQRLKELKNSFKGKQIVVIGDVMVDAYSWGSVKRISPEAPVPVVEIEKEFYRFGGAANVAFNIQKLDAVPTTIGIIGYDDDGTRLKALMHEVGISSSTLIIDENRPTTSKTRVIADNQQIVRIDKESKLSISPKIENEIIDKFESISANVDAVILEDYNKGVLTENLIKEIIRIANEKNIIISVDPKFDNFFEYKNVTVFKPNRKESEDALGMRIQNNKNLKDAGKKLLERLNAKYVLLTLGAEGLSLFQKDTDEIKIPTVARTVADVSGAGDTVISTLTVALTAGATFYEASVIANYAGGLVCGEVGIVPIQLDKLFETIIQQKKWIM